MNLRDTIKSLKYIAASPAPEYGGFHPQTVEIAKSALEHIEKLRSKISAGKEGQ